MTGIKGNKMADITSIDTFMEQIEIALMDLSDKVTPDQLEFAAEQAIDETGFSYPLSGTKKFWAVQRGKRHALDLLRITSSYKFKYKQISLNHRFEQIHKMITQMDEDWKEALNTDPNLMDVDIKEAFGTYLGNGFIYDQHGRDITRLMKDAGNDNEGYRERYI